MIAGQAALIHLDGWTWEDLEVRRGAAMQLVFPTLETQKHSGSRPSRGESNSVCRSQDRLREAIEGTERFLRERAVIRQAKSGHAPDFKTDLKLEAMLPVLEGKMPVMVTASRERAIRDAIQFAESRKFKIVLAGPREFGKTMAEVKARNIPVMHRADAGPADGRRRSLRRGLHAAGGAVQGGRQVRVRIVHRAVLAQPAVPGGGRGGVRTAVHEALKAVTINAAEIWGVADQIGSIEKGKWADLMVTDGDPLEAKTQVKQMFIKGRAVDLANKHTRLYEKYMNRP